MSDWFPAITTSTVLGLALWLFRSLIETRLKNSVKHEFDSELEKLKTELRNSEEKFKADLRTKEQQIEVLRSSAIAGLTTRQANLEKRRIQAVDQLWSAVIDLAPAKVTSRYLQRIKFEVASKEAAQNPRVREFFSTLPTITNLEEMKKTNPSSARPYVSPIVWALFSAYNAIAWFAIIKLQMLKDGIDLPKILDTDRLKELVQVALPHQIGLIEEFGPDAFHFLLDELESSLLKELQKFLQGTEADKVSIERAAAILKLSEQVLTQVPTSFASLGGQSG